MRSSLAYSLVAVAMGACFLANMATAWDCGPNGCAAVACPDSCASACGSPCGDCCGAGFATTTDSVRSFTSSVYADFLLLRPLNAGVEFAVPVNGPTSAGVVPVQYGPTAEVDPNFGAGFMVGFDTVVNDCGGRVYGEFTNYHVATNASAATSAPYVLQSMVVNPTTLNAGSDALNATADETVDFDLVDLGYHYDLWTCNHNNVGLLVGLRYGHLGQTFDAQYSNIIQETVSSHVNFDCIGPRFGLDGNWCIGSGFFVHGKAAASFVGGEARADYLDSAVAAPTSPIDTTNWHEARFTSILDTELSVGWQNCTGRFKVSAGYSFTDWCDVVKPSDFIAGVQVNNYRGTNQIGETSLLFEGFMARAEVNW